MSLSKEEALKRFPILRHFAYEHLPLDLQRVSKGFCDLAWLFGGMDTTEPAEMASGLRKLLEAKDCFVRAFVP